MLKVIIEIMPGGDEGHPQQREIGHLNIGLQRNVEGGGGRHLCFIPDNRWSTCSTE